MEPTKYSSASKSFEEKVQIQMKGKYDTNICFSGSKIINFEGSTSKGKEFFLLSA